MILFLLQFLREHLSWKIPSVFEYYSTRMALSAITSLIFCIVLGPHFIKKLYELKIGQPIRMEECPQLGKLHEKKKNTPTMGGILILSSMLISMLLWMDLSSSFTLLLFFCTISIGCIGGYDDYLKLRYKNSKGLAARKKYGAKLCVVLCICGYLFVPEVTHLFQMGNFFKPITAKLYIDNVEHILNTKEFFSTLYLPFFKTPIASITGIGFLFLIPFIVIVITGSSNAVNLTDGLDGLATGCCILSAAAFTIFAFLSNHFQLAQYLNLPYLEGSGEIAIYLCGMIGACLGFLWYNGHPAQVFMGDTGSLALGSILGLASVLLRREVWLAIIGAVFVAEALSVIIQIASYKLCNKKRVFLCAPLHHHFEYKGWHETKIVIRFWIIALLCAILGLLTLKFQ